MGKKLPRSITGCFWREFGESRNSAAMPKAIYYILLVNNYAPVLNMGEKEENICTNV